MKADDGNSGLVGLISFPVTVLGPGKRLGIWLQGCTIHCANCVSPHTWEFDEANRLSLDQIAQKLRFYGLFTDKLTISGGEPFEQPRFLRRLLETAREAGYKDIFVYSGKYFSDLCRDVPEIIELIDVLIEGPFMESEPTKLIWRGSANQIMQICTKSEELHTLYKPFLSLETPEDCMQIIQTGNKTFVVGIPRQGRRFESIE